MDTLTALVITGRRLCEGFCLLQNRQMYEVPQGEYIALESRRPDVRKPTLWAVIGRDFVHRFAAMRRQGLKSTYLSTRTNLIKCYKLSATTEPLLLHRRCYKPFLIKLLWKHT